MCLGHAAELAPDLLEAELRRIGDEGTVDVRGTVISAQLLGRLLGAVPCEHNRPVLTNVLFEQASFQDGASFNGAIFRGRTRFHGATFQDLAGFVGATFEDTVEFREATFQSGVRFNEATFQRGAWFTGATFQRVAQFIGVTFQAGIGFDRVTFQREAWFDHASFIGVAGFDRATFQGVARFDRTTFHDEAWFDRVKFQAEARFDRVTFHRGTGFVEASFKGGAWFNQASFQAEVGFDRASFQAEAGFVGASFHRGAGFDQVTFRAEARFVGTSFQREARFVGASFEHATQFGPVLARELVLDNAVFGARVRLEVAAASVCARRVQFPNGAHLRLRYATVVLDDANLAAPAILAGAPSPFSTLEQQEKQAARAWQRLPPGPRAQRWRPRLLSVRRADVAGLRLAGMDLRACRFVGAHNLDRLRIEGAPLFARTAGWRSRRKTLAEEQHWRAHRPGRWRPTGWYPRACQPPASPKTESPDVPGPAWLAAVYRDLRKGREDAKDEPGAADFYFGECEMRRHTHDTPKAERLVLWAYWLLSGYGLRAWRALAALAVVVVLIGTILAFWGFPSDGSTFRPAAVDRDGALVYQEQPADPPPGLGRLPDAIRFSARSATALLRGPDRVLTALGEWLEIGLRFAGPVLLGLSVLSVRGRVRR